MKKIDFEKSVALAANIGVIAEIVFLALELRQNTDALQAQTRSSITDNNVTYLGWVATNPELAEIRERSRADGVDSLSDAQRLQLNAFVSANFRIWENTFYQYERGLFTQPGPKADLRFRVLTGNCHPHNGSSFRLLARPANDLQLTLPLVAIR
jgi:hypothetical protein